MVGLAAPKQVEKIAPRGSVSLVPRLGLKRVGGGMRLWGF